MKIMTPIHAVGWAAGVFGAEKSFLANPILGSRRLNELGLHRARVRAAERMARFRRSMLRDIPAEDRAAYDRDGFVIKENYLPMSSTACAPRCSGKATRRGRCARARP